MEHIMRSLCVLTCISCIPLYGMEKEIEQKLKKLPPIANEIGTTKEKIQKLQVIAQTVTDPAKITIPKDPKKPEDTKYTEALTNITTFFKTTLYNDHNLGSTNLADIKKNLTETELTKIVNAIKTETEKIEKETEQKKINVEQIKEEHAHLIIQNIKLAIKTIESLKKIITGNQEELARMSTLLTAIDTKLGDAVSIQNKVRIVDTAKLLTKSLDELITLYTEIRTIVFAQPPPPKTEEQKQKEEIAEKAKVTQKELDDYTNVFVQLLQAANIAKTPDNVTQKDIAIITETVTTAFSHLKTNKHENFKLNQQNIATQITDQNKTIKANTTGLTLYTERLQALQQEYLQVLAERFVIQAQFNKEEYFVVEKSLQAYGNLKELPEDINKQTQAITNAVTASSFYTTPSKQIKALEENVSSYFDIARKEYKKLKNQ